MSDDYDCSREELDPEVLADLQLRARTLSERGDRYLRPSPAQLYRKPVDAAQWKCRFPRCEILIGVADDVVQYLENFNAELATRGERAIPTDAILVCPEHLKLALEHRAQKQRERSDRMRDNIRKLRASELDPNLMPDVLADLRRDHHPDVDGMVAAMLARLNGSSGGKKRRARL